jgi:hypothetical protein
MIGEHERVSTRFSSNGAAAFDGTNIHDSLMNGGGTLSEAPADQILADTIDDDQGNTPAAKHGHAGDSAASDTAPAGETLSSLDLSDLFGSSNSLAVDPLAHTADATDNQDFASLFSSDDDAFVFSAADFNGDAMGGNTKVSFDSPHDQSLNLAGGFDVAGAALLGASSGWDTPVSISFSYTPPSFDLGGAQLFAGPGFGGDITPLDVDFFARSGGSKSGGGTSGGGGGGVLKQYLSGSANGTAGFDIVIDFTGRGWTADLQKAFINAADYFTSVITDDIGGGGIYQGKVIDDLYISAQLTSIDGVGGILGQAGPTAVWTANDLTAAGQMQFDSADAKAFYNLGLWDDIVTHEMMHVLGFGSLWNYGTHSLVSNYQYTGVNAVAAYNDFLGLTGSNKVTYIPVETDGGAGTAGSHWDEQALTNELMTGYIDNPNYLSEFSVMSLADLGYHVTYQGFSLTA